MIFGNMVGGAGLDRTFIIEDEKGNKFMGVVVDKETIFNAKAHDIRAGKVAATDTGVVTGEMVLDSGYHYAKIDPDTGICLQLITSTSAVDAPDFVEFPVYDENYLGKYHIDGNWYEDAAGTIPWTSPLL